MKFLPTTVINSKIKLVISISLILFLVGLIFFLFLFVSNLSQFIKESLSYEIILQNSTSKKETHHIQNVLNHLPFTKSTNFVPKEKAIKQLALELGQNPADFLEYNPLPNLIVIHLKSQYSNLDSLEIIKNYIKNNFNSIKTIEFHEKSLKTITSNIAKINYILLSIITVLLFISFVLINNAIRLTIHSKRFLIRTMQLVGAKNIYVYKPFIISNIAYGAISSCIACGFLYWLINYIIINFSDIKNILNPNYLLIIFGSVLLYGIFISFIATYVAVNKYININLNKFHKNNYT